MTRALPFEYHCIYFKALKILVMLSIAGLHLATVGSASHEPRLVLVAGKKYSTVGREFVWVLRYSVFFLPATSTFRLSARSS